MVQGQFAGAPTPEVLALIPAETARGLELDAQGVRLHVFIAADLSGGWQIYEVGSRDELDRLLASFPLHSHQTETITQLRDDPPP